MYSYGPPHMARQKQDDQLEHTYSSYVRIRDVTLKTCQRRWTIGRSGERGSGISVPAAWHDDDDPQKCLQIIYLLYIWKQNLVLNKQQWLMCQKTQTKLFKKRNKVSYDHWNMKIIPYCFSDISKALKLRFRIVSCFRCLGSMKYPFIAITPQSTVTRSGSRGYFPMPVKQICLKIYSDLIVLCAKKKNKTKHTLKNNYAKNVDINVKWGKLRNICR